MKKITQIFILFILLIGLYYLINQKKRIINTSFEKDKNTILKMCGCYEVTFNYAETFNYSNDSMYIPSPNKHETIYEWIDLAEKTENKLVLQHILQTTPDSSAFVIKHWRQDWQYEDINLYYYSNSNKWVYTLLPKHKVKGKWSQKVFQIDDTPRYSGVGKWIYVDEKIYWESTTDAPLARRESMIRSDYNILNRGNRVEITDYGWLHEQDNKKVVRSEGNDYIIAMEKGYNTYRKVDDSKCQMAIKWWAVNNKKWKYVRESWHKRLKMHKDLEVILENNSISLYNLISEIHSDSINLKTIQKIVAEYIVDYKIE